MNAEISHAPSRFAALWAHMLRLELERAGVSVTESGGAAGQHSGMPAAELHIYVDESANTELTITKPDGPGSAQAAKKVFGYPFRIDDFMQAALHAAAEPGEMTESETVRDPSPSIHADKVSRHVIVDGAEITLTEREYRLFCYLYERRGRPVSRAELLENVWGGETGAETNVVEVYVSYLRHKLEGATGKRLILTRRGKGYEFRADQSQNNNK